MEKYRIAGGSRLHGEVEISDRVMDLAEKHPHLFLRCHQSYLVNSKYILGYSSGELLLYGKKRLPISRRYAAAVRETLAGGNGDE